MARFGGFVVIQINFFVSRRLTLSTAECLGPVQVGTGPTSPLLTGITGVELVHPDGCREESFELSILLVLMVLSVFLVPN